MILFFFVALAGLEFYRAKRQHKLFMAPWAYSVISAAAVGFYPWLNVIGQSHALTALALLISVPLFVILLGMEDWSVKFIGALMYLNAGITFYNGWGMANAGSFDAAIFAAALPIFAFIPVFKIKRSWAFHIGFAVVFMLWTRSNTAALILASYAVFYGFKTAISRNWPNVLGVIGLLGTAVLSLLYKGIASGNARAEGWKHYIGWWWDNANHYFGTGIGTFQGMGPLIPEVPKTGEIFLYMHNDYLQMLFEGGFIGLGLFILAAVYLLHRTWKNSILIYSVIGFLVCMLSYSPLHIIIGQLSICILIFNIIYERNEHAI